MQNYTKIKNPFLKNRHRNIIAASILIILPLVFGGVFLVQQYRSNASVIAKPRDFRAVRLSATSAQIDFITDQKVKATILCSMTEDGVKFFCGQDSEAVTEHTIKTEDESVNLNTGQGYYVFSTITGDDKPMGYIFADSTNPAFGLQLNSYDDDSLGLCYGDEGYNPQLDINQDGCVYTNDLVEVY